MSRGFDFLPDRFNIKWLYIYVVTALFMWGVLLAGNIFILRIEAGIPLLKGMAIITAIIVFLPCLLGFFGARVLYLVVMISIAVGLSLLFYHYFQTNEDPGLIGMTVLFAAYAGGLLLGIVLQLVSFIISRKKQAI